MRSLLFTPGDSDRKLAKSLACGADVILLDLEDAVAIDRKSAAREKVAEFLDRDDAGRADPPLYVRINDLETEWAEADLAAIVPAKPAGIMLPKARALADVETLSGMLDAVEQKARLEVGNISILILAPEIPEAMLNIASFMSCGPRVTGIAWGSEDLAASLGARSSLDEKGNYRAPMELARTICLCAAAAAGIHAIDTVHADFRDLDGLSRHAERAAADGFSGKLAIHPDQVPIINAAFTPSDDEVTRAKRIIAGFDAEPEAGAINLDGTMVDKPHLDHARKVLKRAGLI